MSKPYYVGSYRDDSLNGLNRGWIVGTFLADEPRQTEEVEIKYWEFKKGEAANHPLKSSSIIECTFVLKGSVKALIDNEEVVLGAGQYAVIHPGTPNNLIVEILEDCAGLTVKAPSDPTAKQVL